MSMRPITRTQSRNLDSSQHLQRKDRIGSPLSIATRAHSTRSSNRIFNNALKQTQVIHTIASQIHNQRSIKYFEWNDDYYQPVMTAKLIKPMLKESYSTASRSKAQAISSVVPEVDSNLVLIPANAVQQETVKFAIAPRRPIPTIVRYVRKHEKFPVRFQLPLTTTIETPPTENKIKTPIDRNRKRKENQENPSKPTAVERIIYRDRLINGPCQIRRPKRRLSMNFPYSNTMLLTECN